VKPTPVQQALAALAVLFVVAVTIAGGLLLSLSENPGGLGISRPPTSTPYRIPTLAPTTLGNQGALTPDEVAVEPSPTPTSIPSMASGASPTATAVPPTATTTSPTPRPSATTCGIQTGWVAYTVRAGDTLSMLAQSVRISSAALQAGNCLTETTLYAGQTLYLPNVAISTLAANPSRTPTGEPTPGPTPTNSDTDGSCSNVYANITSPAVGALLSGVVQFKGTATHEDFSFYKLELREYNTARDTFITFVTAYEPVTNGVLGELDTRQLTNGMYWIRVVVVDSIGNWPEPCSKLYRITN
jgi:LysM repeat protein